MPVAFDQQVLSPAENVETRQFGNGLALLREPRRGEYLAVSIAQRRALALFDGQRNVQQVLHALLRQPVRPSVREFYELVATATAAGFLLPEGGSPEGEPRQARRWPRWWGPRLAMLSSGLFVFLGVGFLTGAGLDFLDMGLDEWGAALVWLLLIFSAANLLAGLVVGGCGRWVYGPTLSLARGLPYLHVDTRDAFMGGPRSELAVALQKFATPFLAASLFALAGSRAGLTAAGLAVLIYSYPFGRSPAHLFLRLATGRHYQLAPCGNEFLSSRLLRRILSWRQLLGLDPYVLAFTAYVLLWLAALLHVGVQALRHDESATVLRLLQGETLNERLGAALSLGVVLAALLVPLVYQAYVLARNLWAWRAARGCGGRPAALAGERSTPEEIAALLAKTVFFSPLPPEQLAAVAPRFVRLSLPANATVIGPDEANDRLYVVAAGEIALEREDESGTPKVLAIAGPGDLFGERGVLGESESGVMARSRQPAVLLALPKDGFAAWTGSLPAAAELRRNLRLCSFLKRVELFADWPNQALLQLAAQCSPRQLAAGEGVITQDQPNDTFYLIYTGEVEIVKDGSHLLYLGDGDFFGENSLLHNLAANATVVASKPTQCLTLNKEQFLAFLSHDLLTGFAVETIAQARSEEGSRA